jgi:DNA-binding NarL/FixJ family response regulator
MLPKAFQKFKPELIVFDETSIFPSLSGMELHSLITHADCMWGYLYDKMNENNVLTMIRSGITLAIERTLSPEDFVHGVVRLLKEKTYLDSNATLLVLKAIQELNHHLFDRAGNQLSNPREFVLTKREKEVVTYLVQGNSNREIAKKLYISEKTVKNHMQHIFNKMGVQDRTKVAVLAIQNGLASVSNNLIG